jgi:hypothetical protein
VGEGVAQDLALFPFARRDDPLGQHAGPPSANRDNSRRDVPWPQLGGADHRPRSAAAPNRPHPGRQRAAAPHNQTQGHRLKHVTAAARALGAEVVPAAVGAARRSGLSSACLVGVATAILPPLETAVIPEGGSPQHRRHRPVQKFAPKHAGGIDAGD